MQFNGGCGQILYIGHSSENVLDNFFFIFIYVEVQIEQIKMIQRFVGLAGLIFEINGKN